MKKIKNIIFAVLALQLLGACSTDELRDDAFIDKDSGENSIDGSIASNPYWGWVLSYPGFVKGNAERITKSIALEIAPKDAWLSTGLYVAPGENVEINVSGNSQDIACRIGGFDYVTTDSEIRYGDMNVKVSLGNETNTVMSYFGGHLYILNEGTESKQITLEVTGVVESPDFHKGETDPQEWRASLKNQFVPWGELFGESVILTLPVSVLDSITDPEAFISFYDDFVTNYIVPFYGFDKLDAPVRLRIDAQLSDESMSENYDGTYPTVIHREKEMSLLDLIELSKEGIVASSAFTNSCLEEGIIAHGYKEALFISIFHQLSHKNGQWADEAPQMSSVVNSLVGVNNPARRLSDLPNEERALMFVQLAQQYGWGVLNYAMKTTREGKEILKDQQDSYDAFAMYATEYAGEDLTVFFAQWGFSVSSHAVAYMNQFTAGTPFWTIGSEQLASNQERTAMVKDRGVWPQYDTIARANWEVIAMRTIGGEEEENTHEGSPVSNMLDSDPSTIWHSKWESNENGKYPHFVEVDLESVEDLNYVYYQHRNTTNRHNKCRRLQFQYRDADGNWKDVDGGKVFYLGEGHDEQQRIYFKETCTTSALKLILLSPHPVAGNPLFSDNPDQALSVSIAEFGIGLFK